MSLLFSDILFPHTRILSQPSLSRVSITAPTSAASSSCLVKLLFLTPGGSADESSSPRFPVSSHHKTLAPPGCFVFLPEWLAAHSTCLHQPLTRPPYPCPVPHFSFPHPRPRFFGCSPRSRDPLYRRRLTGRPRILIRVFCETPDLYLRDLMSRFLICQYFVVRLVTEVLNPTLNEARRSFSGSLGH